MFTCWRFMHSSISLSVFFSELCIGSPVLLFFKRLTYTFLALYSSLIYRWIQPGTVFQQLDTRQSEILTSFLGIARLISIRIQDICLEISSDCKYRLGLKVEATLELRAKREISMFSSLGKVFQFWPTESIPDEYQQKLSTKPRQSINCLIRNAKRF